MDSNTTPTADDVNIIEADDDSSFGEFVCCVCLDLLYKPVVLACGHISCFWCVFQTMNTFAGIPVPNLSILIPPFSWSLSFAALFDAEVFCIIPFKIKPFLSSLPEEEKEYGDASPQLSDTLTISHSMEKLDSSDFYHILTLVSSPIHIHKMKILKRINQKSNYKITVVIQVFLQCLLKLLKVVEIMFFWTRLVEIHNGNGTCSVVCADVACTACKNMLFRPVVLNCGHVYCESCLISLEQEILTCQVCQSVHPCGLPRVCLILEHFLEEQFPKVYAQRRDALLLETANQNGNQPNHSTKTYPSAAKSSSSIPKNHYLLWWTGNGPKVHVAVGCDYCGMQMSPIIGDRYKCKDCVEKIGFDLCEKCYKTPSKLPSRFNQQHRPDRKFEIVEPNILFRQEGEESEDDDGSGAQEDAPPPTIL